MTNQFYPVVIARLSDEDGGGYAAYAPDLYGCMSDGETPEEAFQNLQDAIEEWCAEMKRLGREIPEPGSAANAAKEERQKLIELIQEQDKLLRAQEQKFGKLKKEVEAIKDRVMALLESETELSGGLHTTWAHGILTTGPTTRIDKISVRRGSAGTH